MVKRAVQVHKGLIICWYMNEGMPGVQSWPDIMGKPMLTNDMRFKGIELV